MSTIQVEESVKKRLFSYAAKLQAESGRKVSLSEAIDKLLQLQQTHGDDVDKEKLLALFGVLRGEEEQKIARKTFRELRQREERAIEQK